MHGVHDVTCKALASVVPLCFFVFVDMRILCLAAFRMVLLSSVCLF